MNLAGQLNRFVGSRVDWLGRRTVIQITATASAFPLLVVASFYLFVCLARINLGHWPVFNDPFPRFLPSEFPALGIALGAIIFPFVSAAGIFLAALGRRHYTKFPAEGLVVFNVVSAALLILLAQWDPGGFLNWFLD